MAGPLAMVCMLMVYDSIMNMTRRLTRKITIKLSKFGKQVTWLNGHQDAACITGVYPMAVERGRCSGSLHTGCFWAQRAVGGAPLPPRGGPPAQAGGAAGLAPCMWPWVCPEQSLAAGGSACAAALGATCPLIEVYLAI